MPYQPHRGNPEAKQYFVVNNLIGGMNTLAADDVISTIEAREVLNMHLSGSGALTKRKGFSYATILNSWVEEYLPTGLPEGDIFFIKVIKDEGNISRYLSEFDNYIDFSSFLSTKKFNLTFLIGYATGEPTSLGERTIKVDLLKLVSDFQENNEFLDGGAFSTQSFTSIVNETGVFSETVVNEIDGGVFVTISGISNLYTSALTIPNEYGLTNIDVVSYLGKQFILLNQMSDGLEGILQIDEVQPEDYVVKVINNDNLDNLYKPSPIDVSTTASLLGYNMLYNRPQDNVKNHTALRNLVDFYITDGSADLPYQDLAIPTNGNFIINVLFSGAGVIEESFEIELFTEDVFGNRKPIEKVIESVTINDGLAKIRVQTVDSAGEDLSLENENTIFVTVSLIKSEEGVIASKYFESLLAADVYYSQINYVLESILDFESREQLTENQLHNIWVRDTVYDFDQKKLAVYRQDGTYFSDWRLAGAFSEKADYVLKDDNLVYLINGRSVVDATVTEYGSADYNPEYELGIPGILDALDITELDLVTYDYNFYIDEWINTTEFYDYIRDDAVVKFKLYDLDAGNRVYISETNYLPYRKFLESDTVVGGIYNELNQAIVKDEISEAFVLQTSSVNNVIPEDNLIIQIDDPDSELDDVAYYRKNPESTTGLFSSDFTFIVTEETSKLTKSVEYPVQDSSLSEISGITFDGARILEINDRLVAYKGNTIWFSDFRVFNYFPSNTYFNLSISSDDEIVSINYFRGNYIIFTRKQVWKLYGNLDLNNLRLEVLNDSIGCIAPRSIRPFNNTLVFMTKDGLYRIKQNFYLDGLENVEKIDKRIPGVLPYSTKYESMLYNEQYILYIREKSEYNALRYYYNINLGSSGSPFVVDIYSKQPDKIFDIGGLVFAIKDNEFWTYDEGYSDFLHPIHTEEEAAASVYKTRLKLPNFSFGYSTHEKKFKNIFLKTAADVDMPLLITIKIDGYEFATPYNFNVFRDGDGIINYQYEVELQDTALGSFVVSQDRLGETDVNQHKIIVGGKGKNITLILEQETDGYFAITNIGYLFKLGKVRGDV